MKFGIVQRYSGIVLVFSLLVAQKTIPTIGYTADSESNPTSESTNSIPPSENPITLCGLQPGESYQFGELNFTVRQVDVPLPEFLLEWDYFGPSDQFENYPNSVATYENSVYVADSNTYVSKFSNDGIFLLNWGGIGNDPGQFMIPAGVAVDTAGDIYVVDSGEHRIQKFTSDGAYLLQWGKHGRGDGEFKTPWAVDVVKGIVYVAEGSNHRIQMFTSQGEFLGKLGSFGSGDGQFSAPRGLAINPESIIYVADTYNDRIQKFTKDWNFLHKWGEQGIEPGQFDQPHGLALDSHGQLYVADFGNHRIQKFNSEGNFLSSWGSFGTGPGKFKYPTDVAINDEGMIYVSDSYNHRIQKFDPNDPCLKVKQIDKDHPLADSRTATGKYWKMKLTDSSSLVGDLTLPHDGLPNPQVCRWSKTVAPSHGYWDCDADSSTASTVTRKGVSQFSDWTVGFSSNDQTPEAPQITSTGNGNLANLDGTITLLGNAEPGDTVSVWLDSELLCYTLVPRSGHWDCYGNAPGQAGSFIAAATSKNAAGFISEASYFTFEVPFLSFYPMIVK